MACFRREERERKREVVRAEDEARGGYFSLEGTPGRRVCVCSVNTHIAGFSLRENRKGKGDVWREMEGVFVFCLPGKDTREKSVFTPPIHLFVKGE